MWSAQNRGDSLLTDCAYLGCFMQPACVHILSLPLTMPAILWDAQKQALGSPGDLKVARFQQRRFWHLPSTQIFICCFSSSSFWQAGEPNSSKNLDKKLSGASWDWSSCSLFFEDQLSARETCSLWLGACSRVCSFCRWALLLMVAPSGICCWCNLIDECDLWCWRNLHVCSGKDVVCWCCCCRRQCCCCLCLSIKSPPCFNKLCAKAKLHMLFAAWGLRFKRGIPLRLRPAKHLVSLIESMLTSGCTAIRRRKMRNHATWIFGYLGCSITVCGNYSRKHHCGGKMCLPLHPKHSIQTAIAVTACVVCSLAMYAHMIYDIKVVYNAWGTYMHINIQSKQIRWKSVYPYSQLYSTRRTQKRQHVSKPVSQNLKTFSNQAMHTYYVKCVPDADGGLASQQHACLVH